MLTLEHELVERGLAQDRLTPDRESGVIPDVQLHAAKSRNGYRYSEKAMRSLVDLYEGIAIFANHKNDDLALLLGSIKNPRLVRSNGEYVIRGDAEFDTNGSLYESIMDHAKKRPHLIRFSHEVPKGQFKMSEDGLLVEDVYEVRKLSLIAEPGGVNNGIYESAGDTDMTITSVQGLTEQYGDLIKVIKTNALKECECQKEGGAVEVSIELQSQIDKLRSELAEKDCRIEELEHEFQLIERRKVIREQAEESKRKISDDLLEMLCGLEGDGAADKVQKIIEGLPLMEVKEDPPRTKARSTTTETPPTTARRNPFAGLWN